MSTSSATQGVCLACRYESDCIYEAAAHRAILQCEQFELAPPAPAALRSTGDGFPAAANNGFAGLCSNCEFRHSCIYPKPDGGVWRCEEYR